MSFVFGAGNGVPQIVSIPAGVTMTVSAAGAQGASGEWLNGFPWGVGGAGGTEQGTFTVGTPTTLTVIVGDSGTQSFSGGGALPPVRTMGAGGGGSFVFDGVTPLVIAGGGGGAGSCTSQSSCAGGDGGAGGDATGGTAGQDGLVNTRQGGHGGGAGTPSAGGGGGAAGDVVGQAGQAGYGPVNGPGDSHLALPRDPYGSIGGRGGAVVTSDGVGGGGGGGWTGGGGGGESWFGYSGGGGGGGSGYISPQATSAGGTVGTNLGAGGVVISYTEPNDVSIAPAGGPVNEPATGSTPQTFTVTLPASQSTATAVSYETVDGSAKAADNAYTAVTQGSLVIPAGQTTGQIEIDVDDGSGVANVGAETYQVELTNVTGGVTLSPTQSTATGQITVPGISGTVTDAQGKPMPNVALVLSGEAGSGTAVSRRPNSDQNGRYSVFVDPGSYKLTATAPKGRSGQLQPSSCPDGSQLPGGCQLNLNPGASDQIDFSQTAPEVQIDWRMPSRLNFALEGVWGAHSTYGLPPKSYVNPSSWKVTLIAQGAGQAIRVRTATASAGRCATRATPRCCRAKAAR